MKNLFLALSALSLCACSIDTEELNALVDSISLQEEVTVEGITCRAEGEYPSISGLSSRQIEININSYFDKFAHQIQEEIRNCKEQYASLIEEGTELSENTTVSFRVTRLDDQYLSILLLKSKYFDGAAYPNNTIDTFVFDLSTGQPLQIEDITSTDLLPFVQKQFTKEHLGEYPSETSNPIEKFYLTDDALVLVDLFMVHAMQGVEVEVPLAEITDQ